MAINTTNSPIPGADGTLIPAMGDITGQTARALERVHAGLITDAVEPPADGTANISDADTLSITNSAGEDGHDATVAITGNDITGITLADTVAMIDDGTALVVPVTGTYTDTITPTIADGVVTGFVLS